MAQPKDRREGTSRREKVFLGIAIVVMLPRLVLGEAGESTAPAVKRVVTKFGAVLFVRDQKLDKARLVDLRFDPRICQVEEANSSTWHWIKDEESGTSGWMDSKWLVPFDQAIDYLSQEIRTNPNNGSAYSSRGLIWQDKQEYEKAIADYNEAIRLDPKQAVHYCRRGISWSSQLGCDKAISDFSEAIRLNPEEAACSSIRGITWVSKQELDKAIADFSEAIRLDPKLFHAHLYRIAVAFSNGRNSDAMIWAKELLEKGGWQGEHVTHATLLGHFAARRAGKDAQARAFLDDFKDNRETATWPGAIIRYLLGNIDENKLLDAAFDHSERIEAHFYLAFDLSFKGKLNEAIPHFRWIKDQRNWGIASLYLEMSRTELERLEESKKGAAKP